jgi:hypothetical protein
LQELYQSLVLIHTKSAKTKLLLKQVDPEQLQIDENESPVPFEEIHFDVVTTIEVEGQNVNITHIGL